MFLKSYFPYDGQNSARIRKNNGKDNKFEYNLQIFEPYEKSKDAFISKQKIQKLSQLKFGMDYGEDQSEIPLSFNGFYKVAVAVQRQRVMYTDYSGFASPALGSAHFHVSWLSDFIFYQKPLYKSLHQSLFYSS